MTGQYGCDWINLAQDTDQWRNLVKAEIHFRVRRNAGKFSTTRETTIFWADVVLCGVRNQNRSKWPISLTD
jgi:hypothetical protein